MRVGVQIFCHELHKFAQIDPSIREISVIRGYSRGGVRDA